MQRIQALLLLFTAGVILTSPPHLSAAPKKHNTTPAAPDSIDVIAQLPVTDGPAVQLVTAVHWRRHYLYLEHGSRGALTVVDVTDPQAPKSISEFILPPQDSSVYLYEMVGTAALMTTSHPAPRQSPETVLLVSFADRAHPKVVRQFSGVTCRLKDSARGLIYLTNGEGLWVLRESPATDIELQKQYEHDVIYNR
jgi:hypothetical protein